MINLRSRYKMLPQNAYFDNYHIYFQNKIVFSIYLNINFLNALGIGKIKPRYGKLTLRNCCTGYKIIILRTRGGEISVYGLPETAWHISSVELHVEKHRHVYRLKHPLG